MKPVLSVATIITLIAGLFVVGRLAGRHPQAAATRTARPTAPAAATAEPPAAVESPATMSSSAVPQRPATVEVADSTVEQAPLEETAAATAARRVETDQRLTRELGDIAGEQRRLLLEFNDRAIEFQRRLSGELQRGTVTHEEYMAQVHGEMLDQLQELAALVDEDQYRRLTGLEPGADPFEFMTTGVGGAPGSETQVGGAR